MTHPTPGQWGPVPPEVAYHAAVLEELRKIRREAADQHRRLVSTLLWLLVGIPVLLVFAAACLSRP